MASVGDSGPATPARSTVSSTSSPSSAAREILLYASQRLAHVARASKNKRIHAAAQAAKEDSIRRAAGRHVPHTYRCRGPEAGSRQNLNNDGPSGCRSKVIVLKLNSIKLSTLSDGFVRRRKTVTLNISSAKLRLVDQRANQNHQVRYPISGQEEVAQDKSENMAPGGAKNPHDVLDDRLKDVIHHLYDLGNITHGYVRESREPLVQKSIDLTQALASLAALTADDSDDPASSTIRSILVPPEVIDYVANGRNPDIYNREFVENVQRGNQVLNGKMRAYGSFAEIYARETKMALPELAADMDRVMEKSGAFERDGEAGDWKIKGRSAWEGGNSSLGTGNGAGTGTETGPTNEPREQGSTKGS